MIRFDCPVYPQLSKSGNHAFTLKTLKRRRMCDVCKHNIDTPAAFCKGESTSQGGSRSRCRSEQLADSRSKLLLLFAYRVQGYSSQDMWSQGELYIFYLHTIPPPAQSKLCTFFKGLSGTDVNVMLVLSGISHVHWPRCLVKEGLPPELHSSMQ